MIVITPTNNKGGVGKTKVSILLAEYFAKELKKNVLAIDFDPQCNFSHRFLLMELDPAAPEGLMPPLHPDYDQQEMDWDGRSSIADIFYGHGVVPYSTYIPNLDIAPGYAIKLLAAEAVRKNEVAEKVHQQLAHFLSAPDVKDAYDIVVVDTAPSKGPLTVSAIKAATHIVIPCVMEAQPVQGIYGMLQLWMQESFLRSPQNPLHLLGILPNMFKPINLHKDILESLKNDKAISKYILPLKLGNRAAFAEVDSEGAIPSSVFDLPDSSLAKKEAVEFCDYIARRIFEDD